MGLCIANGVSDPDSGEDMSGWYVRASRRVVTSVEGVVQATLEFFKDKAAAEAGKAQVREPITVAFTDDYEDASLKYTPNLGGTPPDATPSTAVNALTTAVYNALRGRSDLPFLANATDA